MVHISQLSHLLSLSPQNELLLPLLSFQQLQLMLRRKQRTFQHNFKLAAKTSSQLKQLRMNLPVTNLLFALVFLQRSDFSVSSGFVHPVLLLLLLHLLH